MKKDQFAHSREGDAAGDVDEMPVAPPRSTRWERRPDPDKRLLGGLIALVLVALLVGSWLAVVQLICKPSMLPVEVIPMPKTETQNLYIGYDDVVYKRNGQSGSLMWSSARLQQPYKPDRMIGSMMQMKVQGDVVYVALEYAIFALQGSSGKQIWQYPQVALKGAQPGRFGIMDFVLDKDLLYLDTIAGTFALDLFDGTQKWTLPPTRNGRSIVAGADGTVYLIEYGDVGATISALDSATGRERWHFQRERLITWPMTNVTVVDDVVMSDGNPLYALVARTGKKLWELEVPYEKGGLSSASAINGVVYFSTAPSSFIQQRPPQDYLLYALDSATGRQLWQSGPGQDSLMGMIDGGKTLLLLSNQLVSRKEYTLQAVDAKNGVLRWQITTPNPPCTIPNSVCPSPDFHVDAGRLYLFDNLSPGSLRIFDAHNGKQLGRYPVAPFGEQEAIMGSMLANGLLYVATGVHEGKPYYSGSSESLVHHYLHAIRLSDGKTAWKYDLGALVSVQVPITGWHLAP